jgi:hypothetical protein
MSKSGRSPSFLQLRIQALNSSLGMGAQPACLSAVKLAGLVGGTRSDGAMSPQLQHFYA